MFSHKSIQSVKKITYTCLRTLKASIGTITIFTRRSGSERFGPLHGLNSRSEGVIVLIERLQPSIVALPTLRALSDGLSSPSKGPSCCLNFL